jgi:hypothetical protein
LPEGSRLDSQGAVPDGISDGEVAMNERA